MMLPIYVGVCERETEWASECMCLCVCFCLLLNFPVSDVL